MNRSNNKMKKPEPKYPLQGRAKVNKHRKYKMFQLDLVARVESVARIQESLERSLECR